MSQSSCMHISQIREVTLSVDGCEDCLNTGDSWCAFASAESAGMWAAATLPKTSTRPNTTTYGSDWFYLWQQNEM